MTNEITTMIVSDMSNLVVGDVIEFSNKKLYIVRKVEGHTLTIERIGFWGSLALLPRVIGGYIMRAIEWITGN